MKLLNFKGLYFNFNLITVLISVIFTIIILTFHYRGPNTKRVPKWVRTVVIGYLGRVLCFITKDVKAKLTIDKPNKTNKQKGNVIQNGQLAQLAEYSEVDVETIVPKKKKKDLLNKSFEIGLMKLLNSFEPKLLKNSKLKFLILKEILNCQLGLIEQKECTEKEEKSNEMKEVQDEWKIVATIIDRLCFFLYLFVFIGTLLLFLYFI